MNFTELDYLSLPDSRKKALRLGEDFYYTGKPCKRGHVNKRRTTNRNCLDCERLYDESRKEYFSQYTVDNRERRNRASKEWRLKNPEKCREQSKRGRERNRDKSNARRRERYRNDHSYKVSCVCRHMLKRTLEATNQSKKNSTAKSLGYTREDLLHSIESKFLDGMSWDNYGEVWNIDHKDSVSHLVSLGICDPAVINGLDNLIPMFKEHNFKKSSRTLEEFIYEFPEFYYLYGEFIKGGWDG